MKSAFVFGLGSVLLVCAGAGALSALASYGLPTGGAVPSFKKVFFVVFENEDYTPVMGQPTFASIARQGAILTQLKAETHPSQGNYVALVSGSTQGVSTDSNVTLDVRHIGDLLEAKGRSWKVYLENYPGGCFTGARSGTYVRKHNPFISFKNIQGDPARCAAHLVNASQLETDIASGQVPDYSLYIPDLNNDGHDTGVAFADRWVSRKFVPLLADSRFMQDLLLVFTFDEDAYTGGNRVYTALVGGSVVPGSRFDEASTHMTLLKMVEDRFELGGLGQGDTRAMPITGIWK